MLAECLLIASLAFAAIGDTNLPAPPGVEALAKANRKVESVFGEQFAAADSAAAKSSLADELVKAAGAEDDSTIKFALLSRARDLATDAGDMRLAVDVVRRIVSSFAPAVDSVEPAKYIDKGSELWDSVTKDTPKSVATIRKLEAAAWYLRAEPAAKGLDKALIEKRLGELVATAGGQVSDGIYLSTLKPDQIVVFNGWEITSPVAVAGVSYKHGLSTHPSDSGQATLMYNLPKKFRAISGGVGINDSAGKEVLDATLIFRIVCDGKTIWKSKPLKKRGESQTFNVKLPSGRRLELIVDRNGSNHHCHAAWLDACLSK